MLKLFFVFFAVVILSSCSSDERFCDIPLYSNQYYDSANVNPDYPCVINACGYRVCNNYEEIKNQYSNYYYDGKPCNK